MALKYVRYGTKNTMRNTVSPKQGIKHTVIYWDKMETEILRGRVSWDTDDKFTFQSDAVDNVVVFEYVDNDGNEKSLEECEFETFLPDVSPDMSELTFGLGIAHIERCKKAMEVVGSEMDVDLDHHFHLNKAWKRKTREDQEALEAWNG